MSRSATYFVAATIVTSSPTRACTSANRSRMTSGDCTDESLHAALAAAAPVREEELGVAARAQVDALDRRDSGAAQRALGRRPQIESDGRPSGPRRSATRPRRRPRSSTARSPDRRLPRSRLRPRRRPRRRCRCSTRASRHARARGCARRPSARSRSAGSPRRTPSIGCPGSSLHSPSPGSPRTPARFTVVA